MIATLAAALLAVTPVTAGTPVEAPGPNGPLAGTMLGEGKGRPVVLIIPGSGPTDRDGNSPLGITAGSYRLLAEALAAKGVATVRVDKRGMFGSKAATPDPNAVMIADYAADAHAWARIIRARTAAPCIWMLGHSEGGLVALLAAQQPVDLCGVILVSSPGRPLGAVLREQFRANPANAPYMGQLDAMMTAYETGKPVDRAALSPPIAAAFPPQLDGYMQSLLSYDPAKLAAMYKGPVLVEQGTRDLQVSVTDAQRLAAARPGIRLVLIPGANHALKAVASDDRAANIATYADPSLPLADGLVEPIVALVKGR